MFCNSTKDVNFQRKRGLSLVYYCKKCKKYFSINFKPLDEQQILEDHLDGLSFKKIGKRYGIGKTTAWEICNRKLKELPNSNHFTHKYCSKWSSTYIVDGKYIPVKGYKRDIPLLWGVDYNKHDFPVFMLARSENLAAWLKYFELCRILKISFNLLVCDDNPSIKYAARDKYPNIQIQMCYNHFKESLRKTLRTRSVDTYKPFVQSLEELFSKKRSTEDFNRMLFSIFETYKKDKVCLEIIVDIERRKDEFLAFQGYSRAPVTNNLIECFNSHLEDRVKSIRSFQSFKHAQLWLNGYILKRRYTKFTSCSGKFKRLNGRFPLEFTKRDDVVLPDLF